MQGPIALIVSDLAVLSSLRFALSVEGFELTAAGDDLAAAAVVVIDRGGVLASLGALAALRAQACHAPAIILSTHPTAAMRARAAAAGATIVEKAADRR